MNCEPVAGSLHDIYTRPAQKIKKSTSREVIGEFNVSDAAALTTGLAICRDPVSACSQCPIQNPLSPPRLSKFSSKSVIALLSP